MNELTLEWHGQGSVQSYTTTGERATLIGRGSEGCDVVLDPQDRTISRKHAEIFLQDNTFHLRNLSQNPIHYNDDKTLKKDDVVLLQSGDTFRISNIRLHIVAIMDTAVAALQLRCVRCDNVLPYERRGICPYCGASLTDAATIFQTKV